MRRIGSAKCPYTVRSAVDRAEKDHTSRRVARMIAKERQEAYLSTSHQYELLRGDMRTGRIREMLGSEARDLNRIFEDKFYRALDTDPKTRLWRWTWLKHEEEKAPV